MMSESDLNETERRLYLSYFEDGVLDVVAGLPVLMFGLGMLWDASMLFILAFLPLVFFLPLKQAITLPRIGYVKFRQARRRRISRNMVVLLIAGTLSFLLGILAFWGFEGQVFDLREFMLEYGLLVFGAIMAGAFVLVSLLFEIRRFIGYAALVFGGWLTTYLVAVEEGIPVAAAGGLISLIGLVILFRFLANTPIAHE